jgi:hypothetical protein
MPGENRCFAGAESHDCVSVGDAAWDFHAQRSDRHPRYRKARDACWPFSQRTLHVCDWHMTFEGHTGDDRSMTRCQSRLHTKAPVKARAIGIVNDLGTSINSADHGAVRLLGVATRVMRP